MLKINDCLSLVMVREVVLHYVFDWFKFCDDLINLVVSCLSDCVKATNDYGFCRDQCIKKAVRYGEKHGVSEEIVKRILGL